VPAAKRSISDEIPVFGEQASKIAKMTGVYSRRVASAETCASDLCYAAAESLMRNLNWAPDSVEGLFLVTQNPDYMFPGSACSLQQRLGLSKECAAFDLNLGCSGYVYGLWVASSLLAASGLKRVLLLAGDTATKTASPQDSSVATLFGDAGTATALEPGSATDVMSFHLGTDGTGVKHLYLPAGGFRNPHTQETCVRRLREDGNTRSDEDVYMNGSEIFAFTLREVPKSLRAALAFSGWTPGDVDAFVPHQANQFMLEHLAKRTGLKEKMVLVLGEFGNTSSASIPLAMTARLREPLQSRPMKLLLSGFGIGLSWATVALIAGPIVMPELAEVQ
jgi:3-oxoacyl-[acyl-carrier-protein] synthase-3